MAIMQGSSTRFRSSGLLSNVVSGLGGYIISLAVTFFLAPVLVRGLGDARYGVWSLISELTGYSSLLDIGIRGAVTYYIAHHAAVREYDQARTRVASAFWALCGLGSILTVTGLIVAANFNVLFKTGGISHRESFIALAIMAVTVGVGLPMAVYSSVLIGLRQMVLFNAIEIGTRVLAAVASIVIVKHGGGLVHLSLAIAAGRTISWMLQAWTVNRGEIPVRPRFRHFSRSSLRELVSYGSRSLVLSLCTLIINRKDLFVVSAVLGVQWVTYYTLGAMLSIYANEVCSVITRTFTPYFSHLNARNERSEILEKYLFGSKAIAVLAMVLIGGLCIFGRAFLRIWIDPRFVTGSWTSRSDVVMLILAVAVVPRALQNMGFQFLFGTGGLDRRVLFLSTAEAASNLVLSIVLVRYFQLAGVAFATFLPALLVQGMLLPAHVLRRLGIGVVPYLRSVLVPALFSGLCVVAAGGALQWLLPPDRWLVFFAEVAAAALIALLLGWATAFTTEERRMLVSRVRSLAPGS